MRFLNKVEAADYEIQSFIRSLYQLVGNKRYLHDIEQLFSRLTDISPGEKQALRYLEHDLHDLKMEAQRSRRGF